MKGKLNDLLLKLKSIGCDDYVITNENDQIIIKSVEQIRLNINDKTTLIREFGVRIEENPEGITVIY